MRRVTGIGGIFFKARDPVALRALLSVLKAEGCNVLDRPDDSEYRKFGWVIDPDGNRVELWEPAGQ